MRSGVILAGGYSHRFGDADKALADLGGTPMVRWVADRLSPVVDALVINCRAEQVAAIETAMAGAPRPVSVAEDPEPDQGPMAGIMTGLRAAAGEYAAVVACDMPFVNPAVLAGLFERADGHDAAVPRVEGWLQTTQAVYRVEPMADACATAFDAGERRVESPVQELDYVAVDEEELEALGGTRTFRNVNTRGEFERAATTLCRQEDN